jgi:hypothetical protein
MVILMVQKKFLNPDEEADLLEIQKKSEGVLTIEPLTIGDWIDCCLWRDG